MALDAITGAAASYQAAPQVQAPKVSTGKPEVTARDVAQTEESAVVSEIGRDTRIVGGSEGSAQEGNAQSDQDKRQPSEDTMRQAISDINKKLNNTECVFGIHDKTNRVTIRIVDKDTKKVIKELPPEKTLDMIAKAWELAGILVDEKL